MIALLLFHANGRRMAAMTPGEQKDLVQRHTRYYEQVLAPRCEVLSSGVLHPDPTAVTVRRHDGVATATQGPPHPNEEGLTGFYLVECGDRDEAVELAGLYPMPDGLGCIEVRVVGDPAPTAESSASPAQVWRFYRDPAEWPAWDSTLHGVRVNGPLAPGSSGDAVWWDGRTRPLRITEVEAERRITTETEIADGVVLRLERTLRPLPGGGTSVTHRYRFPPHRGSVPDAVFTEFGTDFLTEFNARLRSSVAVVAERAATD